MQRLKTQKSGLRSGVGLLRLLVFWLCLALVVFVYGESGIRSQKSGVKGYTEATKPTKEDVRAHLGKLEVPFIANEGQVNKEVTYYARTFAGAVFVTETGELVYALPGKAEGKGSKKRGAGWSLVERFVGGKASPKGKEPSATKVSYFIGKDPARWRRGLTTYKDISLGEVWQGVRVTLRAHGDNVEKLYTLVPGAKVEKIRMRVAGALSLQVGQDGSLIVRTGPGEVTFRAPVAYQEKEGKRVPLQVAYRLMGESEYGFVLRDGYDPRYPVVIDPLIQATYLGGSDWDEAYALSVSGSAVYVAGGTDSIDFPGTQGGAQESKGGYFDAFVAKLSPDLTQLTQATYLGGSDYDWAHAFAVTGSAVYVAGHTWSTDFPGTQGGAQANHGGGYFDAFVAKLNPDLTSLTQATYLGGSEGERAHAFAVTGSAVYVAGETLSTDFPGTQGGVQESFGGGYRDAFVAKLTPDLAGVAQYTLTVNKSGTGSGTVTSNPSGINCGTDCTETYDEGTSVTLTATPDPGSTFEGWSGDCSGTNNTTMVTMDSDKTCTATFSGVSWTPIPGSSPDSAALAWNPVANEMQMVVRGSNGSLWAATFDSTGAFNNDWTSIPGSTASAPALDWNSGANRFQIVVRAANDSIWTTLY